MMQLDGPGRTLGGADAAAHALGRLDLALAVLVAERGGIGTDSDTGHAGDAFLLADIGDLGADVELRFGKHRGGASGGGSRLGDVLVDELRRMGQPAKENAFGGEIHRTQFRMGFHIEPVGVERHFEHVGNALVVFQVRFDAGAEHEGIGLDVERFGEVGALEANHQALVIAHLRRRLRRIADKDDAGLARLLVVKFPEAVSPDVAVENEDVGRGILFFDGQGILDGHGAADTAAEGMLVVARADALDHDDILSLGGIGLVMQEFFQFNLRQDARGAAVHELGGLGRARACGDDDGAAGDFELLAVLDQRHMEFADVAFDGGDFRFQIELDVGMFFNLLDERAGERGRGPGARGCGKCRAGSRPDDWFVPPGAPGIPGWPAPGRRSFRSSRRR